tara:strand:- start:14526 stop:15452 length:927 start_codon:yes stop_codon:yes gene_type:complete
MKILKPKFWGDKLNIFSILLLPISAIYLFLFFLKKKLTVSKKFEIPIICVGNIYLGGTGKTPLAIFIAKELKKESKPVIIKKFYKNQKDEQELIKNNDIKLILNDSRKLALKNALQNNFNVAILDDGFQDFSINKKINIICFNSKQLIGNGMVIPSGPLRERLSSLQRAQIVVINGEKNENFEKKLLDISRNLKIYYSKYVPANIEMFSNKKLIAFAGIGSPDNFFNILEENNLDVRKKISFPDHYQYKKKDIDSLIEVTKESDYSLITTEKDFFRIKDLKIKNLNYLKLNLEIIDKDKFLKDITNTR